MDEWFTWVGFIAVMVKIVSVYKFLESKDWMRLGRQCFAWTVGIVGVLWAANIDGLEAREVGGMVLGQMDIGTLIYTGLALVSTGSVFVDFLNSRDEQRTTSI